MIQTQTQTQAQDWGSDSDSDSDSDTDLDSDSRTRARKGALMPLIARMWKALHVAVTGPQIECCEAAKPIIG